MTREKLLEARVEVLEEMVFILHKKLVVLGEATPLTDEQKEYFIKKFGG